MISGSRSAVITKSFCMVFSVTQMFQADMP